MGSLPAGKIHVLFSDADTDNSGAIDFEEFCKAVKKGKSTNSLWANAESNKLLQVLSNEAKPARKKATSKLETVSAFRHSYKVQNHGCCNVGNMCSNPDIGVAPVATVQPDKYFITTGNGDQVEGAYSVDAWSCCKLPTRQLVASGALGGAINMSTTTAKCCVPVHWEIRSVVNGTNMGDVVGRVSGPTFCNTTYRVSDEGWNDKFKLIAERCCFGICIKQPTVSGCCTCSNNSVWQQNYTVVDAATGSSVGSVAFGGGSIGGCGRLQPKLASYVVTTHIEDKTMDEKDRQRIQALAYAFDLDFFHTKLKPRKVGCCTPSNDISSHWKTFSQLHRAYPELDGEFGVHDFNQAPRPPTMDR